MIDFSSEKKKKWNGSFPTRLLPVVPRVTAWGDILRLRIHEDLFDNVRPSVCTCVRVAVVAAAAWSVISAKFQRLFFLFALYFDDFFIPSDLLVGRRPKTEDQRPGLLAYKGKADIEREEKRTKNKQESRRHTFFLGSTRGIWVRHTTVKY